MSVQAIDRHLPEVLSLDGLAVMNSADTHGYRYELSPEGALSVMPPADVAHAFIATRIMAWLLAAGYTAECELSGDAYVMRETRPLGQC